MTTEKTRENKVRRKLAREGYALHKSRTGGVVYSSGVPNLRGDDRGGYMIVDLNTNCIVAGEKYDMWLEDVERFAAE